MKHEAVYMQNTFDHRSTPRIHARCARSLCIVVKVTNAQVYVSHAPLSDQRGPTRVCSCTYGIRAYRCTAHTMRLARHEVRIQMRLALLQQRVLGGLEGLVLGVSRAIQMSGLLVLEIA